MKFTWIVYGSMEKLLIQLATLVGIDCISMVVCGWKRIKVKSDNEKKVLRNWHGEGNFSIIVKILKKIGCN